MKTIRITTQQNIGSNAKMERLFCLILSTVILASCLGNKTKEDLPSIKTPLSNIKIDSSVPANVCDLQKVDFFWSSGKRFNLAIRDTVQKEELVIVDKRINEILDLYQKHNLCQKSAHYRKQYQFLGSSDSSVVLVNLFPKFDSTINTEDHFKNWKNSLIIVDDGGHNFCVLEYDVKNEKVLFFQCNGLG